MIWTSLVYFYAAFCELTTCRPVGFGAGPIPWTAIMEWCDREGLDGPDRADFLYLVRSMDRAYLDHAAEQQAATLKSAQKPKGGKIGGG